MADSEEELKSLLMKLKEESEKVRLKFLIQKTKIMASGAITSWEIDRETVEIVSDFIFLDSKITADGDCSHEIKRCLLLVRKIMTNLDRHIKKQRREESRWRRNRMGRSLSLLQIHRKNNRTVKKVYKTTSDR